MFVEYAKADPDDILVRVTVVNRGPEAARLHVLPTLWFRTTWSWGKGGSKPSMRAEKGAIRASHPDLGDYTLSCGGAPELLFTGNESNVQRLWNQPNATPWVKDSFHQYVISGNSSAVNPAQIGTKAASRYTLDVPAGGTSVIQLRLSAQTPAEPFGNGFDAIVSARLADADECEERSVMQRDTEDRRRPTNLSD